jgi:hypothetical protein
MSCHKLNFYVLLLLPFVAIGMLWYVFSIHPESAGVLSAATSLQTAFIFVLINVVPRMCRDSTTQAPSFNALVSLTVLVSVVLWSLYAVLHGGVHLNSGVLLDFAVNFSASVVMLGYHIVFVKAGVASQCLRSSRRSSPHTSPSAERSSQHQPRETVATAARNLSPQFNEAHPFIDSVNEAV